MPDHNNTNDKMHQEAERVDTITLTDYRDVVAKSYPQQLLELADNLIKWGQRHRYSLAVIVAHMACEMAVERVVSKFTGGAPENAGMYGYNLRNDNNRKKIYDVNW